MPTIGDKVIIVVTTAAGVVVTTAAILTLYGFTASGIAYGSMAAGLQSMIGNVVLGSPFSVLQSLGATGVISSLAIVAGVILVGGCVYLLYKYMKKPTPRPKL